MTRISRNETCWLIGAILVGAIIRLSFPGRIAVEHFDEGVYASNLWFADKDNSYPARFQYAPPLLPAAIEWTMILASVCGIRPSGFIPMIPCQIAGIAMIPSIWWVVRRWFGPSAGLTSAWLVATSDFHASYSRTALTDVPVCLFILWGVYFISLAFAKCTANAAPATNRKASAQRDLSSRFPWRDILLAGGFTGIAWWTKYNGWLPLAIGCAGGALWQIQRHPKERRIWKVLTCWGFAAVVAGVTWAPVLWDLQKHGGYEAVASNHRQYIVGIRGWTNSAIRQLRNVGLYENPIDILYSPFRGPKKRETKLDADMEFAATKLGAPRKVDPIIRSSISTLHQAIFETWTPLFMPILCLCVSAFACIRSLLGARGNGNLLSVSLAFAWFAGLTFATPIYYPYPRLVLPWLCSTWICIGLALRNWTFGSIGEGVRVGRFKSLRFIFVGLAAVAVLRLACGSAFAWQDRTEMQAFSKQFADIVKSEAVARGFPDHEAFVYVLGEPAIVFGLHAEGLPYVGPVPDLTFAEGPLLRPTFLVFAPAADTSDVVRDQLLASRFEQVRRELFVPSHLVTNETERGSGAYREIQLYRQIK